MKKEKIIVIGCGEHARMVIENLEDQNKYELFGLTTNNKDEIGRKIYGYEVICLDHEINELIKENRDITGYFLGVGNMKIRERLYKEFDKVLPAVNIIHPNTVICKYSEIGHGNLLEAYVKIANGVKMGAHCIVNSFTSVNHDQTIGDNVLLAGGVSLAGKNVGSNTVIADGATIGFKKNVGQYCIVGDGAVVTKDIPDYSIVYGNPARVIRKNVW